MIHIRNNNKILVSIHRRQGSSLPYMTLLPLSMNFIIIKYVFFFHNCVLLNKRFFYYNFWKNYEFS